MISLYCRKTSPLSWLTLTLFGSYNTGYTIHSARLNPLMPTSDMLRTLYQTTSELARYHPQKKISFHRVIDACLSGNPCDARSLFCL